MPRMPRFARHVIPDVPYHVVQRASHQAFILDQDDRRAMLMSLLTEWSEREQIRVAAVAVMGNHFHLAADSPTPEGMSRFLGCACAEFSRFLNSLMRKRGPNWQGRFWAAPMDQAHAEAAVAYIERNPVAAGLVTEAAQWRWSSAAFHCGTGPKPAIITADYRPAGTTPRAWREVLARPTEDAVRARIRAATSSGRPLGGDAWAERMAAVLGLPPKRPRGRPRLGEAKVGTGVPGTHLHSPDG
jgi:putative transposase